MIEIGESFHKVKAYDRKYIIDADAGFHVWYAPQLISSKRSIHEREFHLVFVHCRIVLITEATK